MGRDHRGPCGCWFCDPEARRHNYRMRRADAEMDAALAEADESGSFPEGSE